MILCWTWNNFRFVEIRKDAPAHRQALLPSASPSGVSIKQITRGKGHPVRAQSGTTVLSQEECGLKRRASLTEFHRSDFSVALRANLTSRRFRSWRRKSWKRTSLGETDLVGGDEQFWLPALHHTFLCFRWPSGSNNQQLRRSQAQALQLHRQIPRHQIVGAKSKGSEGNYDRETWRALQRWRLGWEPKETSREDKVQQSSE